MKPREYCCCAIPLINAGIYATLTEQFAIAVIVGTLSIATPSSTQISSSSPQSYSDLPSCWCCNTVLCSITPCYLLLCGSSSPDFWLLGRSASKWLLPRPSTRSPSQAQEKPIMYRRYVTLHIASCIAVFAIAAAWLIISATRHSTAQSNCETTFFPSSAGTSSEGQTLCDIFTWVDVGVMGGAWVFFALVQVGDETVAITIHMLTPFSSHISSSLCHHMEPLSETTTRSTMHSMIRPDR